MFGAHDGAAGITGADPGARTPLAALEEAILPALAKPPCLVSFSGGRDSSSVLAAAVLAARREGLDPPVPVTLRLSGAPLAEESEWQELVVRHLGLRDWELREAGEEMERLGPLSTSALRRHGVVYPPNTFLQLPLLEAARGGSLLSGFGGDELFATWRWRNHADLLAFRRRPAALDPFRLGYAASPVALKAWRERRTARLSELVWLRPRAMGMAMRLEGEGRAEQPRAWSRWVDWFARRRSVCAPQWSLSLLAEDAGAELIHPLLDPAFLAALARAGGRLGFGDRTRAMRAIFGDLLPEEVLARQAKARYSEVLWGRGTRDFAKRWTGFGDDGLVDPEILRREWLKPGPHEDSAMLLHDAWLREQG
jgi:asparagine synthase (glutamine-hydrolysing)